MVKVKFLRKTRPNQKIGRFFNFKKTVLIRNPSQQKPTCKRSSCTILVIKNVPSPLHILCKVTQKRLHVIVKKKWTFLALFSFLPATASKLSPYFVGQNIILLTKWLFTKKRRKVSQTTVILPYFFQLFFASYFCCCVTSLYLQKYKHNKIPIQIFTPGRFT